MDNFDSPANSLTGGGSPVARSAVPPPDQGDGLGGYSRPADRDSPHPQTFSSHHPPYGHPAQRQPGSPGMPYHVAYHPGAAITLPPGATFAYNTSSLEAGGGSGSPYQYSGHGVPRYSVTQPHPYIQQASATATLTDASLYMFHSRTDVPQPVGYDEPEFPYMSSNVRSAAFPMGEPKAFPFSDSEATTRTRRKSRRSPSSSDAHRKRSRSPHSKSISSCKDKEKHILTETTPLLKEPSSVATPKSLVYTYMLNPLCDILVDSVVPRAIPADAITFAALIAAGAAAILITYGFFVYSICLWIIYSLLDNLDGKQARRLGKDTAAGKFISFTLNSFVTSFSFVMWKSALIDGQLPLLDTPLLVLTTQLPEFLSLWSRLAVQNPYISYALFAAEEYNVFVIPALVLVRSLTGWWDISVVSYKVLAIVIKDGKVTPGMILSSCVLLRFLIYSFGCILWSVSHSPPSALVIIALQLFSGVAYTFLSIFIGFPIGYLAVLFPILCIEAAALRFENREQSLLHVWRLWWPLSFLIGPMLFCKWPLTPSVTFTLYAIVLSVVFLLCVVYKQCISRRSWEIYEKDKLAKKKPKTRRERGRRKASSFANVP